jgi:hypothetical protein
VIEEIRPDILALQVAAVDGARALEDLAEVLR